jgi:hypothetical protein
MISNPESQPTATLLLALEMGIASGALADRIRAIIVARTGENA